MLHHTLLILFSLVLSVLTAPITSPSDTVSLPQRRNELAFVSDVAKREAAFQTPRVNVAKATVIESKLKVEERDVDEDDEVDTEAFTDLTDEKRGVRPGSRIGGVRRGVRPGNRIGGVRRGVRPGNRIGGVRRAVRPGDRVGETERGLHPGVNVGNI